MSDLISRQKAYEVLSGYYHHNTKVQHTALREALDRVPSAESERKTGKWIFDTERVWHDGFIHEQRHCSECDFQIIGSLYNYCPNCGADMRGE